MTRHGFVSSAYRPGTSRLRLQLAIVVFAAGCSHDWSTRDTDATVQQPADEADASLDDAQLPPDRDSDATIATAEAGQTSCLSDEDGDGYGAPSSNGVCVEGLMPNDCNDKLSSVHPGLSDRCSDRIDNDCDGEIDEEPALCQAGETGIACTTTCGSMGTGTCSNECELPSPTACLPPSEVCNFADDDCDGRVDPSMVQQLANSVRVYGQPETTTSTGAVDLIARPGGSWLVSKAYDGSVGPSYERKVYFYELDQNGLSTGVRKVQNTGGYPYVRSTPSGKFVVVASAKTRDTAKRTNPFVQFFHGSDVAGAGAVMGSVMGACDSASPTDLAVLELDDGTVHAAVLYSITEATKADGSCIAAPDWPLWTTKLAIVTRSAAGVVSITAPVAISSTPLTDVLHKVAPIPCRNEWLVLNAPAQGCGQPWLARRYSTSGTLLADKLDTLPGTTHSLSLAATSAACDREDPTILFTFSATCSSTEDGPTTLRQYRFNRQTGAMTVDGSFQLSTGRVRAVDSIESGGRWFITGLEDNQLRLWEARFGPTTNQVRNITLSGVNPGAYPNGRTGVLAVRNAGKSLNVALANSFAADSTLESLKGADTERTTAATVRIACP